MYEQIVVALDGSPESEQVLKWVEPLARQFGSQLTVLRATISPEETAMAVAAVEGAVSLDPAALVEEEQREAGTYLERLAARLRARGLKVETDEPAGPPAEAIVACAKRLHADLIALSTHGRGGLGRWVFGSVADEVAREAPCPVLLVREAAEADASAGTRQT